MSDRIAVLSEGQVQQVGRPDDIYERPRNRFVADFIGETNFIGARLLQLENGQAVYQGPGGKPFRAAAREGVIAGQEVCLSIRPERLHLVEPAQNGAIPCRIDNQVYLGTDLHYHVSLADGSRLTVRTPNRGGQGQRFRPGESAALLLDPDSASVLLD
ncbi:Spermidine/putrescine import ATP-binding protein PotA [compost metagenome]